MDGEKRIIIQYTTHLDEATVPKSATSNSAGYDIFSPVDVDISPRENIKVDIGLKIKIPPSFCGKIYGRSGLALHHNIHVTTGVAIIDPDYRGPIYVSLTNRSKKNYKILRGDRIAQMLIEPLNHIVWRKYENNSLPTTTERNTGGFGSTGR